MTCHRWIIAIALIVGIASSPAFGAISIAITAGDYSNVVTASTSVTNVYYSNISQNSAVAGYYTDAIATNAACDKNLNPGCKNPSEAFRFTAASAVATTGAPYMHWVYTTGGTAPTTGTPITGDIATPVAYTTTTPANFSNITWNSICTKLNAAGVTTLAANCSQGATTGPIVVNTYLIADANGDGAYNSTDEITGLTLIFLSNIPQTAIANTQGLYEFYSFPGDAKVHMKDLQADLNFPTAENGGTSNGAIQNVRFYYYASASTTYDAGQFNNITLFNGTPYFQTAPNNDQTLQQNFFGPLNNGTRYYFAAALQDIAGNVGFFLNAASERHSAIPDQVIGLLSESGKCFIATAAYGSPMAGQVQTLRDFRDRFLMKSQSGRNFVSWYYDHSPKWADKIRQSDTARAVVRAVLWPLVGFSSLALKIGGLNASLIAATLLMLPLLLLTWKRSLRWMREREQ